MESRKTVLMNLFAGRQWRYRHREQTYGHGMGEGEGGMCEDGNTEAYTLPYVKQITNGHLPRDSGNSNLGSVRTYPGRMGREVGGGSRGKGHRYTYGWFMMAFGRNQTQYCRAIILQLQIKKKKKQTHRYRIQTSGHQWEEERGRGSTGVRS